MIAFPFALRSPAKAAGMRVPIDTENYDRAEYPHFHVYVTFQCGRRMPVPTSHWDNAKVIAGLSDTEIKTFTMQQLEERGVV